MMHALNVLAALLTLLAACSVHGQFDPLNGPKGCSYADFGGGVEVPNAVDGFAASAFLAKPFLAPFANPKAAKVRATVKHPLNSNYTAEVYDLTVTEDLVDLGFPQCGGRLTAMLRYNNQFPGPLIRSKVGVQNLIRLNNKIPVTSTYYPATEKAWDASLEAHNICAERATRTGNPRAGTGRGLSLHTHGKASLAPFDGSAEDVVCAGESKYYLLGNNDAGMFWYHDHALHITSENTLAGLEGMALVEPCKEPYNMAAMPTHVLQLNDVLFDGNCQIANYRSTYHLNNYYGDINMVNGIAWPVMTARPVWTRFKALNAAGSRTFKLQLVRSNGVEISSKICKIVGADGSFIAPPAAFPAEGLYTGNAYRWDFVCDFTKVVNQTLYLLNVIEPYTQQPQPFFCFSHLLMKINVPSVLPPNTTYSLPLNPLGNIKYPKFNATLTPSNRGTSAADIGAKALATAKDRAAKGEVDRTVTFTFTAKAVGFRVLQTWVMNGNGWDTIPTRNKPNDHLIYNDIGQNTVEVWKLEVPGGIHPVHVHLIDFTILKLNGADPPPELANATKDVIAVNGTVIVAARYGPNLGTYMFHCHNTVHEDRAMMRAILVRDAGNGLTALTALRPRDIFSSQGLGCATATGSDCNELPAPTVATANLTAKGVEYLKKNYYNVFYPSVPTSPATEMQLKNYTVNPWLALTC